MRDTAIEHAPASQSVPVAVQIGSVALCAGVFALWLETAGRISPEAPPWTPDVAWLLPAFCFGAFLGLDRRSRWALLLVPVLAGAYWVRDAAPLLTGSTALFVAQFACFVAACFLGAARDPLARAMAGLAAAPALGFLLVNVLNAVDAIITAVVLRTGEVVEANPVVRFIGLPGKILLVGLASWALVKRRPSALAWPALVLLGVFAYHLSGLVLEAHLPT